ncbi:probable sucrose-phosphatase 2 [Ziziphus jujuba]|uniref:Probable sucrose-phosphatase 2 n=1 Tax=Ziziphus jujuba TaxID=326968 RepID=A0ABM3ZWN1_ZIZJJ|nr:probable sucrose-phosphatase 2 [Ziziphus jujuba]
MEYKALAYLLLCKKKLTTEGKLPGNTPFDESGNDAKLFSIPKVSNAQEELQQCLAQNATGNPKIIHATERHAGGIIQAVGHFKLGTNLFPIDIQDFKGYKYPSGVYLHPSGAEPTLAIA